MPRTGFGDNAPADAPLQVYNVDSSSFQPTFSPMTTAPTHTTLPPNPSQTQTITNPPGSSQTTNPGNSNKPSGSSRTGSQTGSTPSGTAGPGGPRLGASQSNAAAIVIGTVLGALGLAALLGLIVWYLRRRRARLEHAFNPLNEDDEDPHSITAIRIGGTHEKGSRILALPLGLLGLLGLGRSRRNMDYSRRDILADEDRSFQWVNVSREGSGGRLSSAGPSTRNNSVRGLSNAITERFVSIRNLARGASSAPHSRVPSSAIDWEKLGAEPFSPEVALMADGLEHGELPERTRDGFALSGPSQPYVDPFSERDASSEVLHEYDSDPEPEPSHPLEPASERKEQHRPADGRPPPLRTALPPSADFVPLSPLVEQASQNSLENSSASHHSNSDKNAGSGSSGGTTRSPRPSSILDPNPPSEPIRRSNSWWTRFTKTPLLERRGTQSSTRTSGGFIDFRDPNPPPRLLPIEESAHSRPPSDVPPEAMQYLRSSHAGSRGHSGTPTRRSTLYRETVHGRSASSLQTANTEILERLGGTMDIIQRDGTLDSQNAPATDTIILDDDFFGLGGTGGASTSGAQTSRTLVVRGTSAHSTRTESSSVSIDSGMILSPLASGAITPMSDFPGTASPPTPTDTDHLHHSEDRGPHLPSSPGVLERVRAFERRMSRENASPAPPTNTRRREERTTSSPVTARPSVRYGLVPRPSLFVANPDGSRGSDGK